MKLTRWRFLHFSACVAAVFFGILFCGHGAWSQAARTINVVVAAPPNGPTDILAHLFAEQISEAFQRTHGPTVMIGRGTMADGIVGAEAVARAAPDGSTVLLTVNAFLINPYLRNVNYDPLTSFEPVCYLANSPEVVVVNSASRYRTLADLLNAARTRPGDLTMASFGPAAALHIAVEMLKRTANINMTYIPYGSEVPVANALLGEHVTSAFASYVGVAEYLKAGTLRALATGSRNRIEPLPDVPTIGKSGFKDYEAQARFWLFAPAKTPKAAISQLAGWFTAAMQIPEVKAKLAVQGLYPVAMCGADFGAYIRRQYDEYGRVIRETKINIQ